MTAPVWESYGVALPDGAQLRMRYHGRELLSELDRKAEFLHEAALVKLCRLGVTAHRMEANPGPGVARVIVAELRDLRPPPRSVLPSAGARVGIWCAR